MSLLHRDHPDRRPSEVRTSTAEVICQRTGPEYRDYKGDAVWRYTLGDVAAWVERLRELGAPDDLALPMEADGLSVTLDVRD